MQAKIRFGPGGSPESFYAAGYKSSLQMPAFLADMGLTAFEYQCTRGVRISQRLAEQLGDEAAKHDIALSIHAPYYINLASPDPKILAGSREHLLKSIQAGIWMGALRVVFHTGGAAKVEREEALKQAAGIILEVLETAEDRFGPNKVQLAPETMGKQNQLGNLEEVLKLCTCSDRLVPAIDFGHLNALRQGELNNSAEMGKVLDAVEAKLGSRRAGAIHIHFSPVEFTKAGEKRHWTLLNPEFGPDFVHLAGHLAARKLTPTVICESAGRQAEDALAYKEIYEQENSSAQLP